MFFVSLFSSLLFFLLMEHVLHSLNLSRRPCCWTTSLFAKTTKWSHLALDTMYLPFTRPRIANLTLGTGFSVDLLLCGYRGNIWSILSALAIFSAPRIRWPFQRHWTFMSHWLQCSRHRKLDNYRRGSLARTLPGPSVPLLDSHLRRQSLLSRPILVRF